MCVLCFTPYSTIFQSYEGVVSFMGGGNRSTPNPEKITDLWRVAYDAPVSFPRAWCRTEECTTSQRWKASGFRREQACLEPRHHHQPLCHQGPIVWTRGNQPNSLTKARFEPGWCLTSLATASQGIRLKIIKEALPEILAKK